MNEDKYGTIRRDSEDGDDPPKLVVDSPVRVKKPKKAAPTKRAVDEPAAPREVVYTRGPNGRLIQSS